MHREHQDAPHLVRETVEGFVTRLEEFARDFSRVAVTGEQQVLAEQFRDLVAVVEPAVIAKSLRSAIDKALEDVRQLNIDFERWPKLQAGSDRVLGDARHMDIDIER